MRIRMRILMNMKTTTQTPGQKLEAAIARIRDAEARGLSESTINRRWREYFKAEDEAKAVSWR